MALLKQEEQDIVKNAILCLQGLMKEWKTKGIITEEEMMLSYGYIEPIDTVFKNSGRYCFPVEY